MFNSSIRRTKNMSDRHRICFWMINRTIQFLFNNFEIWRLWKGFRLWNICRSVTKVMLVGFIHFLCFFLLFRFLWIYTILNQQRGRANISRKFLFFFWLWFSIQNFINFAFCLLIRFLRKYKFILNINVDKRKSFNIIVITHRNKLLLFTVYFQHLVVKVGFKLFSVEWESMKKTFP